MWLAMRGRARGGGDGGGGGGGGGGVGDGGGGGGVGGGGSIVSAFQWPSGSSTPTPSERSIALSPPCCDLPDTSEEAREAWALSSPTRLLRMLAAAPEAQRRSAASRWPAETVVLHAADDTTVPVTSARDFVAALDGAFGEGGAQEANGDRADRGISAQKAVQYLEYAEGGHSEILVALASEGGNELFVRDFCQAVAAPIAKRSATAERVETYR